MKTKIITVTSLLFSLSCWAGDLPNPLLTPGALNADVNQGNIKTTVCVKGWTKTVRPPAYYTNKLKKEQLIQYRYVDQNPKDYEEDHLIPLALGGNPTNPNNLWPQPRKSEWNAERKDQLEFVLYRMVCLGEIGLDEARRQISENWITAYKNFVPSHSHLLRAARQSD